MSYRRAVRLGETADQGHLPVTEELSMSREEAESVHAVKVIGCVAMESFGDPEDLHRLGYRTPVLGVEVYHFLGEEEVRIDLVSDLGGQVEESNSWCAALSHFTVLLHRAGF